MAVAVAAVFWEENNRMILQALFFPSLVLRKRMHLCYLENIRQTTESVTQEILDEIYNGNAIPTAEK